ncbi:MAG: O-acetyl-ADP-ribose deacetylase [Pirellulaceae bacterium]|nr:O-acetyl-ADP-ribose deacetylase [Pirellulaceae bacterium]MDP7016118.1 O-acetyl-ADP-ribose deacetylase [Pirellulaceae bacterium]
MSIASRLSVVHGDITTLDVDAIVNAANESLMGGGGVDGAIHLAAGDRLLEECRRIGGCPTGESRITAGYELTAGKIIHTVGPVWRGGGSGERATLASCYASALGLATENELQSVAFPCISTGVYHFPKDLACEIAVAAVVEYLSSHEHPECVVFCCFGADDFARYEQRIRAER